MLTLKTKLARGVIPATLAACALLSASAATPTRAQNRPSSSSASDALAKGNLYYSSDDINDEAAEEYKVVMSKYRGTKEAEAAQYLLASYYHRKFYIKWEKRGEKDEKAIHEAEDEYGDYADDYKDKPSPEWLADSYFNLTLIWREYGHPDHAVRYLEKLREAAAKNPTVYIYDVIWSSNNSDRVEGDYDAVALADVTQKLVEAGQSTPQVVAGIREWCRGQRQRK